VHPQKHLLGDLLGLGPVAQHPQRHAEDAMLVGAHQILEGPRVAPPYRLDQVGLVAHRVRP